MPKHSIAVLGPTCSGKSSIAVELAEQVNGEIISCDSMQIYRGMSIGTAAPTTAQQRRVPHHLVAELDIEERYDANKFLQRAYAVLADIAQRNKTAVLVGGTGMYAKALIYGFTMHPSDPHVFRAVMREHAEEGGADQLLQELSDVTNSIPDEMRQNPRRLMRAVEIVRLTGQFPGADAEAGGRKQPLSGWTQFILLHASDDQRSCIEKRTTGMLSSGWIEEARSLVARGLLETPTARQALGYSDIAAYLSGDDGIPTLESLREKIVRSTVRYARRQRTWFRRQHPGACLLTVRRGIDTSVISRALTSECHRLYSA